ncbi:MAG TPA: hypothetical protein VNM72_05530 [Blastocatellia bacterium]|nr:hypothetical protein [Blastocatellia bacterium]
MKRLENGTRIHQQRVEDAPEHRTRALPAPEQSRRRIECDEPSFLRLFKARRRDLG